MMSPPSCPPASRSPSGHLGQEDICAQARDQPRAQGAGRAARQPQPAGAEHVLSNARLQLGGCLAEDPAASPGGVLCQPCLASAGNHVHTCGSAAPGWAAQLQGMHCWRGAGADQRPPSVMPQRPGWQFRTAAASSARMRGRNVSDAARASPSPCFSTLLSPPATSSTPYRV